MTPESLSAGTDKIRLLVEETGCDPGQAEIALSLAAYDMEKAIRVVEARLRHIVAVKGKFHDPGRHLYGLLILITDIKRARLIRARAVVSYNPALFETALSLDWFTFEKCLYAARLGEGTLQHVSQELEKNVTEFLEGRRADFFPRLALVDGAPLDEMLREAAASPVTFPRESAAFEREVVSGDQFRRLPPGVDGNVAFGADPGPARGARENLRLQVRPVEDPAGVPAEEIRAGDAVGCLVVDPRDIAQYLSKLLGAAGEGGFAAPVEETRVAGDRVSLRFRLSTGILGLAETRAGVRLRVARPAESGWRRWLSF